MASLVWSVYLLWILSDLVQKAVSQKSLSVSKVCREGFFLSEQDVCLPCNCKGHAYSCEDISGICFDCQNHTVGDFCEQCEDSFLPVYQPDGSFVCRPCACPISLESNNFADHCSKRGDFLRCVCQKGYAGHYCERCAPGYYGNPMQVGKSCKKCNCNGNTDPNFIFNECNNVTGQCLNCWGNTGGDGCEKCAPGFYGDAISAKDCSECLCDKCGTASCDDKTGVCHCKPGVTGHLCDKCEEGYSGFSSCMGCHRCECASAALRVTCHPLTNSCQCRPGAGGRYCERCLPGYWKYSQSGCKKCDCPEDNCDMHTGECLPKALDISECNISCDVCIWNLIGDIHQSNKTLDQVKNTVLNISTGAAANDRLKYYNYTANILQVQFSGWRNTYAVMRTEIGQLEKETQNVPTDMNFITTQGEAVKQLQEKVEKESHDSSTLANKLRTNLLSLNVFIEDMIRDWELYSVYQDLEPEEKKQKLVEAEQILSWMRNLHLSPKEPLTTEESAEASELLQHVQHLENLMKGTQKRLPPIQETLEQLNLRLFQAQSLLNKVDDTLQNTLGKYKTNQLKLQRREAQLQYVKNISNSVSQTVSLAKNTMSKANLTVDVVKEIVMKLREQHAEIDGALELMEKETDKMSPSSMHLVLRAEEHSDSLQRQADELQHNLKGSDANGHVEKALDALNVYDRIVNYLNDATVAGVTTLNISSNIHNSFEGLDSHLNLMYHQSGNVFREVSSLYSQQTEIENTVLDNKKYIDETNEMMKSLSQKVKKSSADIQTIQKDLTPKRLQFTQEVSHATLNHSTEVLKKVMPIFNIVEKWNNNMRNEAYSTHAFDKVVLTAGEAVEDLSEILPELLNKLRVVEEKKPVNNISANIMNIRGLIAQARSVVKKVQVSMKFNGQSAVEVHSLPNLEELKTVTSISFYIRVDPDKDPIEDRFLLYLGDKKGNKDYMGLAIKSDNLVFLYNLGGEVVEIPLSSKPVSSWPPVFNLVKVERLGRHGKLFLTVPSQETLTEQKFIQKGEADGTDSLFDLDPKDTVFLVGGVPSDFKVPPALSLAPFVGCIELESLNNDLISLYNFKRLHKMDFKTSVPCPRHKLAFSQSRVTSYLFDGSGFALVNNIEQRGKIGVVTRFDIEVRTVANNGILFLMVNEANFFVLKIKNGFLNLMYNFGFASGSVIMENNLPKLQINDARYHEVSVIYHHSKKIILLVDRSHVKSIENEKKPLPFSDIYIGGAPSTILKSRPELVSLVGLKGCVKGFQFQKKDFNLLEEPGTIGISSGCPEESFMSRQAYFKGDGYLSSTAKISPFQSFEGGFNFKTLQSSGLLFYYKDGVVEFSISLDNGAVVQLSNGTRVRSHKKNYNDGQNHFLVTSVTSQKYQLIIDDKDKQEKKKPLSVSEANSIPQTFYFGGSPKSSLKNFTGCISYAYISRQDRDVEPEDFQRYSENANVLLQDCPLENPTALLLSKSLDNTSIRKSRTFSRRKRRNFVNTPMREMAFCDPSSFPQAIRHTYRYGGFTHSRQGYTGIANQIKKKFQINISLKTHSAFGVLLYLADKSEKNLVALLLKHGKLVLMFGSGQNQVQIRTQRRLNDGQWHDVVVNRSERMGRLIIDSLTVLEEEVPVRMFPQSSLEHLYVGGLSPGSGQKITQLAHFSGCLGNLQLNGRLLSMSSDRFGVTPCYEGPFESGIYFDEEGGFILLDDLIKNPQQLELSMEVRPRAAAGVLLHVFSEEKEYLTMYIYQRQVVAVVSNGSNAFSTTVGLKGICDGNWQKITVTMGATFVQLKVDSEVKNVEWAFSKVAPNSWFPFYIGGCPDVLLPSSGLIRKGYTGCIRNLSVNKTLVDIGKTSLVTGAVSVGRCPV